MVIDNDTGVKIIKRADPIVHLVIDVSVIFALLLGVVAFNKFALAQHCFFDELLFTTHYIADSLDNFPFDVECISFLYWKKKPLKKIVHIRTLA